VHPFELHLPTQLFFGEPLGPKFIQTIASSSKKVLLVTGGGSVERLGYVKLVSDLLAAKKIDVLHVRGVEPNPHAATINRMAAEASEFGADAVLALGGGSVMDAAKAIGGLVACGETDVWEFVVGSPRRGQLVRSLPIFCIPTTAATASEVTPYAVISHPPVNGKSPISSPNFKPVASWLNPAFTTDLPLETTRDGASDILSHVFENYLLGGNDSPLADAITESVITTVVHTLPVLTHEPKNVAARGDLLWASSIALNGFPLAGRRPSAFVLHNIEHAMSGIQQNLAHGRGLATLYPAYFRWLWEKDRAKERFARLGRHIFGLSGDIDSCGWGFITRFDAWLQDNGLWQSASAVGVHPTQFEAVANYCVKTYGNGTSIDALGEMSRDDVILILQMTETQTPRS
jgi:alcohol dehydrogenase YqhD (iron-dependent ADH family)